MSALVTGGFGFLGRHVAAALLQAGHEVTVLDNSSRADRADTPAGARIVDADVRDPDAVRAACRNAELVVHLAAVQGTSNFYDIPHVVLDVNLRGVLNVADACAAEGVKRLLFSSSSECYGEPRIFPTPESEPLLVPDVLNPRYSYGGSKIAGELVAINGARQHGFEFTIVRYHNVYGPAMGWDHVIPQFIRRLERGEDFTIQGDGEQARSFCYVDDAVECTLAAALEPAGANEIFNIGNPDEEYTINELVSLLSEVSGRSIEPQHLPFAGEGTRRRVPDIGKARELLGFNPRTTLADGLSRTYGWYADELARTQQGVSR